MKETFSKYRQLIPLIILIIFSVVTIFTMIQGTVEMNGDTFLFALTSKHYLAFTLLIIDLVLFFLYRPVFKYIFILIILLGLINIINFLPLETIYSFRIAILKFSFQPIFLLVGFLTYLINFKQINSFLSDKFLPTKEESLEYETRQQSDKIEKFKIQYSNYTDKELEEIIDEKRYTFEALEAARQILDKRNENK